MFKTTAALFATIAVLTALPVHAAERQVDFNVDGKKVEGTLSLPDGIAKPPVVLMLHGFTGMRDEWKSAHVPKGLFGQAAETLAGRGIASLRIDFRGSGTSEGKFEDMTVESEIDDAFGALTYLKASGDVDGRKVAVLGMSLGGIVTSAVAGRAGDDLKSAVLWNPGINPPAAFDAIFGVEGMRKGLSATDAPIESTMANGTKVSLRGAFFKSLYRVVPAAEIGRYGGPLLLAVGMKDDIVYPQPTSAEAFLSYHPGQHVLWTRPVDHGFDVERNADTVSALIDETETFLRKHFE